METCTVKGGEIPRQLLQETKQEAEPQQLRLEGGQEWMVGGSGYTSGDGARVN